MKKTILTIIIFLITLGIFLAAIVLIKKYQNSKSNTPVIEKTNYTVSYNGWLHTDGEVLKNEKNMPIQLRGISSHGISWYGDLITYDTLSELNKNWKANVFRIAMYTDSDNTSYIYNSEDNIKKVDEIVDMAINLDMYVIIDWHILSDNNPQQHETEAVHFFDMMSKKYSDCPNVIYEICNEPNGPSVTWNDNIKPYAENLISTIRKNCPKSLIIVGTADWCKSLEDVINFPLKEKNVVYACHFYSGSHDAFLQEKIDKCIANHIPIFVSECGLTDVTGNGQAYFDEFSLWINFLDTKNISWIYWSLSNKNETSSLLLPTYKIDDEQNANNEQNNSKDIANINDYLTESGTFIKSILTKYE